ncbi:6488_t:CDS:1, partial [Entrophospora sp. SA101]
MSQFNSSIPTQQLPTDESGYIDETLTNIFINHNHNNNNGNGINRSSQQDINIEEGIIDDENDDGSDIIEFEEDWEEFVEQLQQMLLVFMIPWLGR